MKIKARRSLLSLVLVGALATTAFAIPKKCSKGNSTTTKPDTAIEQIYEEENPYEQVNVIVDNSNEELVVDETKEEIEEYEEVNNVEEDEKIDLTYSVKALDNAKIYEDVSTKSKQVGLLVKGESLPFICEANDEWYEVIYDNQSAYIKKDNLEVIKSYDVVSNVPVFENVEEFLNVEDSIIATATVNVRKEPNTKCEKYGQLSKGQVLPLIERYNDEWYKVNYDGKEAYVFSEYARESKGYTPKTRMADMVYVTSKTPLYDINTNEVLLNIPKRETAEVYAMNDDYYLASVNGTVGFIDKNYAQSLGDKYVIIDISSQNLKVYVEDELVIDTPVVTGKDSTPTYCGIFYVFKRERKVYWKEFDVTVDYGLDFNRGIWIHDASWRKKFGGNIYHKDGSHGCVNVPKKVMPKVYDEVEMGTPVLVKK